MTKEKDGSITPRTIRHKEFFSTTEELKDEISKYDRNFADQYAIRNRQHIEVLDRQAQNSELLAQLNKYSDSGRLKTLEAKFDKKADIVKKTPEIVGVIGPEQMVRPLSYVKILQHRENDDVPDISFDLMKPTVRHYGIDASNGSIFIGHVIRGDRLHPIESTVFDRALSYLAEQLDTENFLRARDFEGIQTDREQVTTTEGKDEEPEQRLEIPKPNNVVLVSFFPRKGNTSDEFLFPDRKTICADEKHTDEMETHTIVLWKTGPKKITIIDPSDKKFSVFLEDVLKSTYRVDFEIPALTDVKGKIYQPNKYSKKTQQEFARDCTDIAAKIAFELNEKQVMQGIRTVNVVLEAAIEQISNDKLPKEIGLLKPLQSSDVETRVATKELITKFDKLLLKPLDVTKIITLEDVQKVSELLGGLDLEDVTM